jgi:hypothetical protein
MALQVPVPAAEAKPEPSPDPPPPLLEEQDSWWWRMAGGIGIREAVFLMQRGTVAPGAPLPARGFRGRLNRLLQLLGDALLISQLTSDDT